MLRPEEQHDPGGRVKIQLPDGVLGGAVFSSCGHYRHLLTRDWTAAGSSPRSILWIGMNPSVATAEHSDPTCNRELIYSRDWGFSRYLKCNMLDWRATNPRDLPVDPAKACSAGNLEAILEAATESEIVILAYGKLHKRYQDIVRTTLVALRGEGHSLLCLGRNADGSAKHPLYLRKDLKPVAFDV